MWAFHPPSKQAYQVVKYTLKVIEHGTDTDFGKEELWLYNPASRSKMLVDRKAWVIYDNWNQVRDLVKYELVEDEDESEIYE